MNDVIVGLRQSKNSSCEQDFKTYLTKYLLLNVYKIFFNCILKFMNTVQAITSFIIKTNPKEKKSTIECNALIKWHRPTIYISF